MDVLLTVVIPTFNRAHLIVESIPMLMNQRWSYSKPYEIVFVSNGSTDNTEEVLSSAAARYPHRLRFTTIPASGGPAAPRNEGIRIAEGELVVILDDDVFPDETLLEEHAAHHLKYPAREECAIGVAYVPERMRKKPVSLFHEFSYDKLPVDVPLCYTYFWTCNVSFKRQFMLDHGMFDERFLYNEDIVCGHQLAAAGLLLRFNPGARGQHLHQLKLADIELKGRYIGFWIWATAEVFPTPEILQRYGVLSTKIGMLAYAKRVLNRIGLAALCTKPVLRMLEIVGAKADERSALTDFYHYLHHRSAILRGYRDAQREYRRRLGTEEEMSPTELARTLQHS